MIALDTNLLVRLTVQDEQGQVVLVERLLKEAFRSGEPCFISDPVMCELVWVLRSVYKVPRLRICEVLLELLGASLFQFEDRVALLQATSDYRHGRADFADYIIGAKALARGARAIYTFDRKLQDQKGFMLLAS